MSERAAASPSTATSRSAPPAPSRRSRTAPPTRYVGTLSAIWRTASMPGNASIACGSRSGSIRLDSGISALSYPSGSYGRPPQEPLDQSSLDDDRHRRRNRGGPGRARRLPGAEAPSRQVLFRSLHDRDDDDGRGPGHKDGRLALLRPQP